MKNQVRYRSIREKGNGTLEALAVLIVLVLPLLMFTVESTGITRARAVAAQAAQEAARSFATADNTASGTARAGAVVHAAVSDAAVSGAGLSGAPPRISCSAHPCLSPGERITVTVEVSVPLVYFGRTVLIEQSASTTVDRFREARP
ncbi:hypothetical protein ACRQDN_01655 [Actinotignum sp. GS-2025e]|uniref:hypothetical protein n=1 Tax=Actinotignum TaxID=1653174 RepID=UPI000414005F|nr:hypothetical protein [Actinotignum schaalii]AIE82440.1 hypothetical protein FB03_03195 [Actinotignum schaalii]WQN44491.1 hypothetical protein U4A90_05700 [Actinotignum schaalii]